MYQRLSIRMDSVKSEGLQQDDRKALSHLKEILQFKFNDLKSEYNLIVNITAFAKIVVGSIQRNNREISSISDINDSELLNDLNKFQVGVKGNSILDKYYHVIDGFQIAYFPFAVDYAEKYHLPTSPMSYNDLNAIVNATTSNLNELAGSINEIKSNNMEIVGIKSSIDTTDPGDAVYTWKNADVREKIRKLFAGEKITLTTDVNKFPSDGHNSFKFNTIDLVFRSSVQSENRELRNTLKAFQIWINHTGLSTHRCNKNFYQLPSESVLLWFNFEKDRSSQIPVHRNSVYEKLRENEPLLSPYTSWELELLELNTKKRTFQDLAQLAEHDIDIELHATGTFILGDSPICNNDNLNKIYKRIEN